MKYVLPSLLFLLPACSAETSTDPSEVTAALSERSEGSDWPVGRITRDGQATRCTATHLGKGIAISNAACVPADDQCASYGVEWPKVPRSKEWPGAQEDPRLLKTTCTRVLERQDAILGDYVIFRVDPAPDSSLPVSYEPVPEDTRVAVASYPMITGGVTKRSSTSFLSQFPLVQLAPGVNVENGTIVLNFDAEIIGLKMDVGVGSSSGQNHMAYLPLYQTNISRFLTP
jgi:hypothetical protein